MNSCIKVKCGMVNFLGIRGLSHNTTGLGNRLKVKVTKPLQTVAASVVPKTPQQTARGGALPEIFSKVFDRISKVFKHKVAPELEKQTNKINLEIAPNLTENLKREGTTQTPNIKDAIKLVSKKFNKVSPQKNKPEEFVGNAFHETKKGFANDVKSDVKVTERKTGNFIENLLQKTKELKNKVKIKAKSASEKLQSDTKSIKDNVGSKKRRSPKRIIKEFTSSPNENIVKSSLEGNVERKSVKNVPEKVKRYKFKLKNNGSIKEYNAVEQSFAKNSVKKQVNNRTGKRLRKPEHRYTSKDIHRYSGNKPAAKKLPLSQSVAAAKMTCPPLIEAIPVKNAPFLSLTTQTHNEQLISALRNDIKVLKSEIKQAKLAKEDTKQLTKTLSEKRKALYSAVTKSTKKKTVIVNDKKTIPLKTIIEKKEVNQLKPFTGKSFDQLPGIKDRIGVKCQYDSNGKLLRTFYNKGNGLIEVKNANSNISYYMRDGKIIKKSDLETQKDAMQNLVLAISNANDAASVKGLVSSYAKKCGMKRVNKVVYLDGKQTNIMYEGFGYDITADGRVLSKEFTSNGLAIHKNFTSEYTNRRCA